MAEPLLAALLCEDGWWGGRVRERVKESEGGRGWGVRVRERVKESEGG